MRQFIISTATAANSDYRWLPPSKKYAHEEVYLPSATSEALGEVVVIVDNSGSTLSDQPAFFSEANGLLQEYDEVDMHLIVVDTAINFHKVYNHGDRIELNHKGGGGTNLQVAFDYIKQKRIAPVCIVCLTDGYTAPEIRKIPNPHVPTLWVLSKEGSINEDEVPFGIATKIR